MCGAIRLQFDDRRRIKRHDADRAGIAAQRRGNAVREPQVAVEPRLDLEDKRDAPGHQFEQFAERHHAVCGRFERDALEVRSGEIPQRPAAVREPAEVIVVIDHGFAVGRDLQVDFDAVIAGDRGRDRGRRVLDDLTAVVQPAMGNRPRRQPSTRA